MYKITHTHIILSDHKLQVYDHKIGETMKNNLKILIGVLLILICLSIPAVSAADNNTPLEETNEDTVSIPEEDTVSINEDEPVVSEDDSLNYVAKNFGGTSNMRVDNDAECRFSESDLETAQADYMGVVKNYPDAKVIQVKEIKKVSKKVKVYKKVKVTKKFTVGKLVDGRLKMDIKKFNKLSKKYKKWGYKVTDKWSGKKRVLIAKKTVKKVKGYKTVTETKQTNNWITLTGAAFHLTYSSGGMSPAGYYIQICPLTKPYTGMEYYVNGQLFRESYDSRFGTIWTLVSV